MKMNMNMNMNMISLSNYVSLVLAEGVLKAASWPPFELQAFCLCLCLLARLDMPDGSVDALVLRSLQHHHRTRTTRSASSPRTKRADLGSPSLHDMSLVSPSMHLSPNRGMAAKRGSVMPCGHPRFAYKGYPLSARGSFEPADRSSLFEVREMRSQQLSGEAS